MCVPYLRIFRISKSGQTRGLSDRGPCGCIDQGSKALRLFWLKFFACDQSCCPFWLDAEV